jgi:uncharacterized protein YuzE
MKNNKYPYLTYDNEAKKIYIYLRESKPKRNFTSIPFVNYNKGEFMDIFVDINIDNKITGIEILLSQDYNKKEE